MTKKKVVKELKKEVKELKRVERKVRTPKTSKLREFVRNSSIGLHTPIGSLMVGSKGITINPEGSSTNNLLATTRRSGKIAAYHTMQAPNLKGYPNGLRVVASQRLCTATQVGNSLNVFYGFTGAQQASFDLSPDQIGGQCAIDARNYSKFRFAFAAIEYVANVEVGFKAVGTAITSAAQTFVIAFFGDAALEAFQTRTFVSAQSAADNSVIPLWTQGNLNIINLGPKDNLYYTESDTASGAGDRMTAQGQVYASWDLVPVGDNTTVVSVGEFIIHYVLDLYDRSPDYGFTITVEPSIKIEALELLYKTFGDKLSPRSARDLQRLLTPVKKRPGIYDSLSLLINSLEFEEIDNRSISSTPSIRLSSVERKDNILTTQVRK
jgi:hypothetical protein